MIHLLDLYIQVKAMTRTTMKVWSRPSEKLMTFTPLCHFVPCYQTGSLYQLVGWQKALWSFLMRLSSN